MPRRRQITFTPEQRGEAQKLCRELPLIEDRLRRAGLYGTATLMNHVVKRIGYELSDVSEKDRG